MISTTGVAVENEKDISESIKKVMVEKSSVTLMENLESSKPVVTEVVTASLCVCPSMFCIR